MDVREIFEQYERDLRKGVPYGVVLNEDESFISDDTNGDDDLLIELPPQSLDSGLQPGDEGVQPDIIQLEDFRREEPNLPMNPADDMDGKIIEIDPTLIRYFPEED